MKTKLEGVQKQINITVNALWGIEGENQNDDTHQREAKKIQHTDNKSAWIKKTKEGRQNKCLKL